MNRQKSRGRKFLFLSGLLLPLVASAIPANDIIVTYVPVPASIPALSTWGLWITCALLGMGSLMVMRMHHRQPTMASVRLTRRSAAPAGSRVPGKSIAMIVLVLIAVWGVLSGHSFMGDAQARPAGLTEANGGNFGLPFNQGVVPVYNTTSVPLMIMSVTPDAVRAAGPTTCKPGTIVQPQSSCDVDTGAPPG